MTAPKTVVGAGDRCPARRGGAADLRDILDPAVPKAHDSHAQVPVTPVFLRGPAALTLIDRAAQATLLVAGRRSHSAAAEILIGCRPSAPSTPRGASWPP
jgi:hypothetical protein